MGTGNVVNAFFCVRKMRIVCYSILKRVFVPCFILIFVFFSQKNEYMKAIEELGTALSGFNFGNDIHALGFEAKSFGKKRLPAYFPLDVKSGKSTFSGIHVRMKTIAFEYLFVHVNFTFSYRFTHM